LLSFHSSALALLPQRNPAADNGCAMLPIVFIGNRYDDIRISNYDGIELRHTELDAPPSNSLPKPSTRAEMFLDRIRCQTML
jgi:hypothetical protein